MSTIETNKTEEKKSEFTKMEELYNKIENIYSKTINTLQAIDYDLFGYENLDDYKDDIIEKLLELENKYFQSKSMNSLIMPWGHKDNTISQSNDDTYKDGMIEVCCAILLCTSGLRRHRVSTNKAIDRVTRYIKYIRENERDLREDKWDLYKVLRKSLDTAEFPYRISGRYSRYLICSTPCDIDAFIRKLHELKEAGEDIRENPKNPFNYIYNTWYEIDQTEIIREANTYTAVENDKYIKRMSDMLYRNEAIYTILFFEVHGPLRTRYMRDTERITKSEYFRYMQYKAQVMFSNASDDQRTRLTHSLEVAFSAKTIAKQLGCNWELVEAAAMGHDLGHVPFGHQGEEALDECLHKAWAGRFSHALQSVRVLGYLANHAFIHTTFGVNGLYISRPVLECVLKHDTDNLLHDIRKPSWRLQYTGWRETLIGNKYSEEDFKYSEQEFANGVTIGGLESQIVYWADKISYASHDWEELTNNHIIEKMASDVERILKDMHQLRHITYAQTGYRKQVREIKTEIDIIRFIRDYIERIRSGLIIESVVKQKGSENSEDKVFPDESEEQHIIETFKPDKSLYTKAIGKQKHKERCFSIGRIENSDMSLSPLVCFLDGLNYIITNHIETDNTFVRLFTKEQYKLIYDFFFLCHNLIYITGVYPKAYKKTDDIELRLCRYMAEINGREMTKALITHIISASRKEIKAQAKIADYKQKNFNEDYILNLCFESFNTVDKKGFKDCGFDNVNSLASARDELAKYGYFVPNTDLQYDFPNGKHDTKKLKKCFKKVLQSKMLIKLPKHILDANNHIAAFVYKYYIGSERVRAMKNKAHMIIKQIFEFYMEHPSMLPEDKIQNIDKDTQRLCTLYADFVEKPVRNDAKPEYQKKLLVLEYLLERLDEKSRAEIANEIVEGKEQSLSIKKLLGKLTSTESLFTYNRQRDYGGKEFYFLLKKWNDVITPSRMKDRTVYDFDEYYNVCRHIAQARVIADYIASMTERFAEKKYTEIISSQATWTTALL
jgi:predicted deoxyguanosinetriphosphate triphosphohydrolase